MRKVHPIYIDTIYYGGTREGKFPVDQFGKMQ